MTTKELIDKLTAMIAERPAAADVPVMLAVSTMRWTDAGTDVTSVEETEPQGVYDLESRVVLSVTVDDDEG